MSFIKEKFDVIAIGSATKDIFVEATKLKKGNGFVFPLGEKIGLEKVMTFSGGGGVNTATTFALQGLKTAFCGAVGQDLAGQEILEELNQKGIDTDLMKVKAKAATDMGLIFHAQNERTILLFHSASRTFSEKDIDWKKIKKADWLYLAPLWGKAANTTWLLSRAKQPIKVALNPSLDQLKLKNIREILKRVDVLLLNDEEASVLSDVRPSNDKKTVRTIRALFPPEKKPTIVITKGKQGAVAFDGKFFYNVAAPKVKVVDATGAGDSFGSGFVAGRIQGKNIEDSLKLAMANAVSNIQVFGANQGLLAQKSKLPAIAKGFDISSIPLAIKIDKCLGQI